MPFFYVTVIDSKVALVVFGDEVVLDLASFLIGSHDPGLKAFFPLTGL